MADRVFISYASADAGLAWRIRDSIESRGIPCWIAPRDVPPGADYGEALMAAILGSRLVVLIFTSSANESPHVRREIERAVSRIVGY